ncbi:MAG: 4'-phosphopantetheinyl transferase superfamily protein [Deltaproteobacteria bacterium]|nr:4'-phosphopantetheinyl transferase superfamily protein [Deltaproteobacteria bacterium]
MASSGSSPLPGAQLAWQALVGAPDPTRLTDAELELYQTLGPERRRLEWWAGRIAAHEALSACGAQSLSVLRSESGAPRLVGPDAELFSVAITHGRRQAAAIAVRRDAPYPFVGLDLVDPEDQVRIDKISPRVFRSSELLLFAADPQGPRLGWATKEAIAKATQTGMFVFALSRAWLVSLDPLRSNLEGVVLFAETLADGSLLVVAGASPEARGAAQFLAGISP